MPAGLLSENEALRWRLVGFLGSAATPLDYSSGASTTERPEISSIWCLLNSLRLSRGAFQSRMRVVIVGIDLLAGLRAAGTQQRFRSYT